MRQVAIVGLSTLFLAGCSSYYMIRDPLTGKTYYSRGIDDVGHSGAVRFEDELTESLVTLPTSEVTKLSADEFRRKLKALLTKPFAGSE